MAEKAIQTEEQTATSNNELVPSRVPRTLVPELGTPIQYCPSNLDMTTIEGRSLAINAVGSQDLTLDEEGRMYMLARHYLVYQVERLNRETGEMERYPRTVFINDQGETFATTSVVIPDALAAMLCLFSDADWTNGIPICIITKKNLHSVGFHHELRVVTRVELTTRLAMRGQKGE